MTDREWHIVARVARSDIHDRTWYPYWNGGAEGDMFPLCGPLGLVKRTVWSTFEQEWDRLRWRHTSDVWTLEGLDLDPAEQTAEGGAQ